MRQHTQKPKQKFCSHKTAKNAKTHPEKPEKGETGCVLGAGGDGNGWEQVRTDGKNRKSRRKSWDGLVSPAGSGAAPRWGAPSTDRGGSRDRFTAERHWRSLTPRHAVLEWMWEFGSESRGEPGLSCPSHKITKERCWFGAPRTGHAGYPNPD